MSEQLEQLYFEWLCDQVGKGDRNQTLLLRILHEKEFVWFVPNDDNRIQDGLDLRVMFSHEKGEALPLLPFASVLEVLVGLSKRLEFETDEPALGWAEQLLENLELHKFKGPMSRRRHDEVDEVLERLIWRQYQPDGVGGFFPLAWPEFDQTQVEIWYQMSAYVNEIERL